MATDEDRDEIERLIRQACQVPAPDEEFVRGLAARARHELSSTLTEGPQAELPRRCQKSAAAGRWPKAALAAAGLAAAILVGVLLWNRPQGVAWAQVAEAVRAMPWIHVKNHMQAVGGESYSQEAWASFSRNISAARDNNLVQYNDLRSGIRYEYDSQKKKLYRLSVSDHEAQEIQSGEKLFQAIFRGNAIREGDFFPGVRIVKQRQRTVTEQGRRWIQYELELAERQGDGPQPPIEIPAISVVIRVNPEKMLPDLMTVTHGKFKVTPPGSRPVTRGEMKAEAAFDYPAEGPADIYALGVPRDAPVEDRLPPPDLDRIIKIIQQHRRDFGDYLAVANGSRSSLVNVIRCKGDKFRVDEGTGDTRRVASGDEMEQWWRAHEKDLILQGAALGDGRRVYDHDFVHSEPWWKPSMYQVSPGEGRAAAAGVRVSAGISYAADYLVDLLAYPPRLDPQQLASSPLWTTHFDPQGENGPAGSVRVELQVAHRGGRYEHSAYHREEFWLQPKYGYAVVKHVSSDCPAVDADPLLKEKGIVHEYDGFRQTPRGLWYPTVSRLKYPSRSANKNQAGGVESYDQVTYYYLDFTAQLPDELFSDDWRGDPLAGIHFAPQGGKPASGDLGQIRPPGGAPLFLSRVEITCQMGDAARGRLEAAPAKDLDKWVAELQRIADKRVDGWEQQGWRTEFVSRMGVAFDGLKWNAKAAEILFQRAQTIRPSEAKLWKDAFERLLGEKFEPASMCMIPLVMIPVDALYEGQRYSAERAQKYLARLKQLTADDVALWKEKVDQFGGTRLDAAMNLVLLDDYYDKEKFQRDKFKAAVQSRKK
jgi:hypothetical protein